MTDLPGGAAGSAPDDAGKNTGPHGDRFTMYCHTCAVHYIITESRIESKHRSADGLVGYVRCAAGHLAVHQFAEAYPKPKPPQSVIDFRAQLAAAELINEELKASNE